MDMAEIWGRTSTSKRLGVGCLLYKNESIISLGVNGMPPKWHTEVCEDEEGLTKKECRHAEQAALQKLWNSHETAKGSIAIISHAPCLSCSIKLRTAGIVKVYYRHEYRCLDGVNYLRENGIPVEQVVKGGNIEGYEEFI